MLIKNINNHNIIWPTYHSLPIAGLLAACPHTSRRLSPPADTAPLQSGTSAGRTETGRGPSIPPGSKEGTPTAVAPPQPWPCSSLVLPPQQPPTPSATTTPPGPPPTPHPGASRATALPRLSTGMTETRSPNGQAPRPTPPSPSRPGVYRPWTGNEAPGAGGTEGPIRSAALR